MSRVGNNPVAIPEGVTVDIQADKVIVKGKLGELEQPYDGVSFENNEGIITVTRKTNSKEHKSKHGLYRALLACLLYTSPSPRDS